MLLVSEFMYTAGLLNVSARISMLNSESSPWKNSCQNFLCSFSFYGIRMFSTVRETKTRKEEEKTKILLIITIEIHFIGFIKIFFNY